MGVVTEVPVETCDLRPTRLCKNITQMVPTLTPVSRCADFPRKICSFGFADQRISEKPVVTKWCYDESDIEERDSSHHNNNKEKDEAEAGRLPRMPRMARVRVSRLSKSYLPPLREADRRGRQIERLPGLIEHLNHA